MKRLIKSLALPLFLVILCLIGSFTPVEATKTKKINGETVLELPIYRKNHPVQALFEYAKRRGLDVGNNQANETKFLQRLYKKIGVSGVKNESIALFKTFDSDFYTKIGVGHPARSANFLIDTSWSDSWMIGTNCTEWACRFKQKYNATFSNTSHVDGRAFDINLGDGIFGGNITGNLAIDTVVFAHYNASRVTFASVDNIPWFMAFTNYSGILGFGKATKRMGGAQPIWKTLLRQNKIKKALFALYFNRDPTVPRAGALLLGAADPHHYNATAAEEVEVNDRSLWSFKIRDLIFSYVKKKKKRVPVLHFCENACEVLLDSGGNSITGPKDQIDKINDLIGALPFFFGFKRVPCENLAKLPELVFTFGSKEIILYGEHYIQQIYYEGYVLCLSTFVPMVPQVDSKFTWTFGVPVLSKYYTIYDADKNTVTISDYKTHS